MNLFTCSIIVFIYLSLIVLFALTIPIKTHKKPTITKTFGNNAQNSVIVKLAHISKTENIPAIVDIIKV